MEEVRQELPAASLPRESPLEIPREGNHDEVEAPQYVEAGPRRPFLSRASQYAKARRERLSEEEKEAIRVRDRDRARARRKNLSTEKKNEEKEKDKERKRKWRAALKNAPEELKTVRDRDKSRKRTSREPKRKEDLHSGTESGDEANPVSPPPLDAVAMHSSSHGVPLGMKALYEVGVARNEGMLDRKVVVSMNHSLSVSASLEQMPSQRESVPNTAESVSLPRVDTSIDEAKAV